jgi:hypothetical protein
LPVMMPVIPLLQIEIGKTSSYCVLIYFYLFV